MEGDSSIRGSTSSSKKKKLGRGWNWDNEQALVNGLKELVPLGWKTDNGFRRGYLGVVETILSKKFPGTELKATPHINS